MSILFAPLVAAPPSVAEGTGSTDARVFIVGDALGATIAATSGITEGRVAITCEAEGDQSEDFVPILPAETDGSVFIYLEAENFSNLGGDTDGAVTCIGEAASGYGADGYMTVIGDAGDTFDLPEYAFMIEPYGFIVSYAGIYFEGMYDFIALSTAHEVNETALLSAFVGINAAPVSVLAGDTRIDDAVGFTDVYAIIFRELLEISIALGITDTVDYRAIAVMADQLVLSGAVNSYLEALTVIQDALLLADDVYFRWSDVITDALGVTATQTDILTAVEALVDAAVFTIEDQSVATLRVLVPDNIEIGVEVTSLAELLTRLQDNISLALDMYIDNGEYTAWCVNTETTAHTRYSNYPFNSFMKLGGKYYGTSEQGLYRLEGDNDAGADITSRIRLGLSRLNSGNMKRIQSMYLGYRAEGNVLVKVTLADDQTGQRETHVYTLVERGGANTRENRVPIGRGLQSVYWDFEIENAASADFEIDGLEILPLISERRVRGSGGGK